MAISHNPALNLTIPTPRLDLPSGPLRLKVICAGVFEASTDSSPKTTTFTSSPIACRSQFPMVVSRQMFGVAAGSLSFVPASLSSRGPVQKHDAQSQPRPLLFASSQLLGGGCPRIGLSIQQVHHRGRTGG